MQVQTINESLPSLTWKDILSNEKQQTYFQDLISFIERERAAGKTIYPKNSDVFAALQACPFENLKVVIIGQDPYHGPQQAHGLCFSVQDGITPPPSLKNIFKELSSDLGLKIPGSGSLMKWATQGVLLLNAVLTVEANRPGSHANLGWERFTDKVIEEISARKSSVVFMLWGAYAHKKGAQIDHQKHLVLKAAHPSPFSAYNGYLGCKHFSKANQYLTNKFQTPINWDLS